MNANSKPKILTVNQWIRDAAEMLANAGIPSALLDAEIILAHTVRKSRTWLHAHSDDDIDLRELDIANARLQLRLDRTPIAYIIGHKEFYTRLFKVTPSVLVPRPESETMIVLLKSLPVPDHARLVDIGTGSGCLGITAKLEVPTLDVTLADISRHALIVAEENATNLRAAVNIVRSDLFQSVPGVYDVVLANLPYVDESWERSPETQYEPALALFADHHGLSIIERFLAELPAHLAPRGIALIEADPEQHPAIIAQAISLGLSREQTEGYIVVLRRN